MKQDKKNIKQEQEIIKQDKEIIKQEKEPEIKYHYSGVPIHYPIHDSASTPTTKATNTSEKNIQANQLRLLGSINTGSHYGVPSNNPNFFSGYSLPNNLYSSANIPIGQSLPPKINYSPEMIQTLENYPPKENMADLVEKSSNVENRRTK